MIVYVGYTNDGMHRLQLTTLDQQRAIAFLGEGGIRTVEVWENDACLGTLLANGSIDTWDNEPMH